MSGTVSPQPQAPMPSGGQSSGQPPIGSSPATGPSQNLGTQAQALKAAAAITHAIAVTIALAGPSTPLGQALTKAMTDISKHVPPDIANMQPNNEFPKMLAQKNMQMGTQQAAIGAQRPPMPQPGMPQAA